MEAIMTHGDFSEKKWPQLQVETCLHGNPIPTKPSNVVFTVLGALSPLSPAWAAASHYLLCKSCWDSPRLPAWPRSQPGWLLAPGELLRCSPCTPSWQSEREAPIKERSWNVGTAALCGLASRSKSCPGRAAPGAHCWPHTAQLSFLILITWKWQVRVCPDAQNFLLPLSREWRSVGLAYPPASWTDRCHLVLRWEESAGCRPGSTHSC
jgi:hypothetical protein